MNVPSIGDGTTPGDRLEGVARIVPRLEGLNDSHLIEASLAGNAEAFRELVQPCLERFGTAIRRVLQDDRDAQEALRATLCAIHAELHNFRTGSSFATWAHRLCLHEALLIRRSRERRKEQGNCSSRSGGLWSDEGCLPGKGLGFSAFQEWKAGLFWMKTPGALVHLSDSQRAVYVLRDIEGYGTEDVVRLLGFGRGLVRQHLRLARLRLKGASAGLSDGMGYFIEFNESMPRIDRLLLSN